MITVQVPSASRGVARHTRLSLTSSTSISRAIFPARGNAGATLAALASSLLFTNLYKPCRAPP